MSCDSSSSNSADSNFQLGENQLSAVRAGSLAGRRKQSLLLQVRHALRALEKVDPERLWSTFSIPSRHSTSCNRPAGTLSFYYSYPDSYPPRSSPNVEFSRHWYLRIVGTLASGSLRITITSHKRKHRLPPKAQLQNPGASLQAC